MGRPAARLGLGAERTARPLLRAECPRRAHTGSYAADIPGETPKKGQLRKQYSRCLDNCADTTHVHGMQCETKRYEDTRGRSHIAGRWA